MIRRIKPQKKCRLIFVFLIFDLLPLFVCLVKFMPHKYCFFIDRELVIEDFYLDLTDDVKLVSYKDDSFLIAITCELVVEVDDAEKFLQNNIK